MAISRRFPPSNTISPSVRIAEKDLSGFNDLPFQKIRLVDTPNNKTINIITSGGMYAAGSAANSITSGGSNTYNEIASGGIYANGNAIINATYSQNSSSGLYAAGNATNSLNGVGDIYDANPISIEVAADGSHIVVTFGGEVIVLQNITITVDGGTPLVWGTSDSNGSTITYVLPDFTPPIETGQVVTVTYIGDTWETNPGGTPNDPVTDGPVINSSTVPVGSSVPVLLSAQVESDGITFTLTWDRNVEILVIGEGITAVSSKNNGVDNGDMNFGGGDGSNITTLISTGFAALSTDTVTFSVAAENWESTDYHVKTIAYTDYPVTNLSTQV